MSEGRTLDEVSDAANVWDDVPDWGGVGARRLVRHERSALGASIWEIQPGSSQFVYHYHHGSEELLIVLRGSPTVRTSDGDRELAEGDVLSFPRGPEGGHQIRNDRDATVRVLIVSTNVDPDVAEYPETGTLSATAGGELRYHRTAGAVEHAGQE